MDRLLHDAPLFLLGVLLFAGLLAAREVGGWLGRRLSPEPADDRTELGYILSGVLGLLALLIAFTFSLALNRYEARRDLVVAEANAIGTAEMRVRLLDAPHAANLANLYRDYAETRLSYGRAADEDKPALRRVSEALRGKIQAETLVAVQPLRTTPLASLVVQAVNDSLDVGVARETALGARLPANVLGVLVVYALMSAMVLGAALRSARHAHRIMTGCMFLLLTLAMGLILDLDRPRDGSIRISQASMARLVESLRATPLPAAASAPPSPATEASPGAGGSSRP